jgi:hypothetical protein
MKFEPADLAEVLRRLASMIEPMTKDDLEEFLETLRSRKRSSRIGADTSSTNRQNSVLSKEMVAKIIHRLQVARSREEGFAALREFDLNRRDLVEVARARSVHITKEDSVARIEERLVEGLVGSRLSSQAIRGTNKSS